ncbi:hypothetical protein QYM36_019399 [Artemia franciscana]|uniref:Muskelin N-terminal domain-containing protein n=1 Tax=Artemia franciscana TaxID=6661 RepID=A0AA88HAL3_ARTSF|nr:hypothetical protein QYM36_019399 [Artemia franciscana]
MEHYRERLAVRLCLKHLRQLGCLDAFEALKKKKNIRLEDPRLTELHDVLVLRGDFVETERVLERAMDGKVLF